MRRPGICGATETILIDFEVLESHLPMIISSLQKKGCLIKGDADVIAVNNTIDLAAESDWSTEYLDKIVSIKTIKKGLKKLSNI